MRYFNICSRRTIPTDNGEKNIFQKVGVIKATDNRGWYVQLYQQPNADFQIFPSGEEILPIIEA